MTQADAPQLEVAPTGEARGGGPWRMAFGVRNTGTDAVEPIEAWMPREVWGEVNLLLVGFGPRLPACSGKRESSD